MKRVTFLGRLGWCAIAAGFLLTAAPSLAQQSAALIRTQRAFPTGDPASSAVLLERLMPAEVRLGEPFTYQIRVTNLTAGRIENLGLSEQFPPTFSVRTATPRPAAGDRARASWTIPLLAAGATETFLIAGATDRPDAMDWCATVTFTATACATVKVVEPRLAITKTMPPEALLCDDIPVRITVGNIGTGMARGVRVTDALPSGLTTTDGRNSVAFDVGDLAAGQSREVTFVVRAARSGEFRNVAEAVESGGARVQAEAATRVRQPVLAVTKRGPPFRYLGRGAEFEITVTNAGDGPARDTVLTDTLPPGVQARASDGGQVSGGSIEWRLGTLDPGASRTVRMSMTPGQPGAFRNRAEARAYCAQAGAEAELEVRGIPAILLECVDDPDPIEVGREVTYTIVVTNQGTAQGTNIIIECTLPPQQEYVSSEGPTRSAVVERRVRFDPLPSLAPRARAVYKVVARGIAPGDVRFHVSMRSDQLTSPVEETESTYIY